MSLPILEELKDGQYKVHVGDNEKFCKNKKEAEKEAHKHMKFLEEKGCRVIVKYGEIEND